MSPKQFPHRLQRSLAARGMTVARLIESLVDAGSLKLWTGAPYGRDDGARTHGVIFDTTLLPTDAMYRVSEGTTVATVTDLRRRTCEVMNQAEDGSVVVVQKDNQPQGVYLSFSRYEAMLARLNKLENLELVEIAMARKEAIDRGETGTTSLEDMIAKFAPQLQRREPAGA